jgi:cytochrome P450
MLPHSFLLGHLIPVGKIMAKMPRHTSPLLVPLFLAKEYPEVCSSGVIYLDSWPIATPTIAVFHPDIMAQFTQETSLPKHEIMVEEFGPFTQCNDLVNQEGEAWKTWRGIFNPGFSAKNLLSLVPEMVEEILVFRDWLKSVAASGEVVILEDQAKKVTIDIINRVVVYV